VKVSDDFGKALGYEATDTFRFVPGDGKLVGERFEGNDPPDFSELQAWIAENRPEIVTGPCKDLVDGGTTPAACARAVSSSAALAKEKG